ncbi:MAG: DUF4956 domain-containing protein [Chloroflexota bacterium]
MSRKFTLWSVTLLLGLAVLGWAAAPACAQEGPQGFTETFDAPELPGWEHAPEVIVSEGVLRIGPAQFAARPGSWQDFTLSFKLRYSGEGETHINYRASDQGSYLLALNPEGVTLLRTIPQSEPRDLGHTGMGAIRGGEWMDFQITLAGGEHTITANGEALIHATDPDPLGPGSLIFASMGQRTTELDDVSLQTTSVQGGIRPVEPAPTAAPTNQPASTGSWQDLLRSLSASQGSAFEADVFAINLILAVVTSFILSRVYIYWGSSLSNRRKFAANFMLLTVTTTFIILVVRSSVALSLGLVGALSIIRFRAAIKEPEELAYLFFAISLGIGLGDNQRAVTLITLAVVVIIIGLARLLRQTQSDVNLHLAITSRGAEKITLQQAMDVLAHHADKLRLLRYDETLDAIEMSFVVEFRHISDLEQARAALQTLSPFVQISFLDNKGVW